MKFLINALTRFSFIQRKYHFLKCCTKYAFNPTQIIYLTKRQLLVGDWALPDSGGEKQPLKALEIFLYVKRWLKRVEFEEPEDLKQHRVKNGKPIRVIFCYGKPDMACPTLDFLIAKVARVEDFYDMGRSVVSEIIVDFLIDRRVKSDDMLDFSKEQNKPLLSYCLYKQRNRSLKKKVIAIKRGRFLK